MLLKCASSAKSSIEVVDLLPRDQTCPPCVAQSFSTTSILTDCFQRNLEGLLQRGQYRSHPQGAQAHSQPVNRLASPGRSQTFMFHQTSLYNICRYEWVATGLIFMHQICSRCA
jgi:hypothetical protein